MQRSSRTKGPKRLLGTESSTPIKLGQTANVNATSRAGHSYQVTAGFEQITPEYARHVWNNLNTANRKVHMRLVNQLKTQISTGDWTLTGQSLGFNTNGELQDGQHRILAIALAETPVISLVVRGLEPSSFVDIDCGKRRNAADALHVAGFDNAAMVASVVRRAKQYQRTGTVTKNGGALLNKVALAEAQSHPGIEVSVAFTSKLKSENTPMITATQLAFCHYVFSGYHREMANEFVRLLTSPGGELVASSDGREVIAHLRKRYSEMLRRKLTKHESFSETSILCLAFSAWNTFARVGRQTVVKFQATKKVDGKFVLPKKVRTPGTTAINSVNNAKALQAQLAAVAAGQPLPV